MEIQEDDSYSADATVSNSENKVTKRKHDRKRSPAQKHTMQGSLTHLLPILSLWIVQSTIRWGLKQTIDAFNFYVTDEFISWQCKKVTCTQLRITDTSAYRYPWTARFSWCVYFRDTIINFQIEVCTCLRIWTSTVLLFLKLFHETDLMMSWEGYISPITRIFMMTVSTHFAQSLTH